jgi:hypothetical protein
VNGGEVVPLEKQADIKIVDHARKEALPGTYVALGAHWIHRGLDLIHPTITVTPTPSLRSPYAMAIWKISKITG